MDIAFLVPFLALGTLLAVAVFALWNGHRTRKLQDNPDHRKSTLAADGPDSYGA